MSPLFRKSEEKAAREEAGPPLAPRSPSNHLPASGPDAKLRHKPTVNGPATTNQKDPQMRGFIEPGSTLGQLDRQLRELTREHGHVLRLDEFRRHL
jgi:hypothetical protein